MEVGEEKIEDRQDESLFVLMPEETWRKGIKRAETLLLYACVGHAYADFLA